MSGGHSAASSLYLHRDSPAHALPAHCKLVATIAFVLVVALTPRTAILAFLGYAALLAMVAWRAKLPAGVILRRMVVEVPFVIFALALPFFSTGERIDVFGLSLSINGLWAAWNVLIKATLGVASSVILASTTDLRDLVIGLQRMRLPSQLVLVLTFMLRYADVITQQWSRMRIARVSRGFTASDLRAWPVLAASAGTLFVRSYERGERVHLAMQSRGFTGTMPMLATVQTSPRQWATAAMLPVLAALILAITLVTR